MCEQVLALKGQELVAFQNLKGQTSCMDSPTWMRVSRAVWRTWVATQNLVGELRDPLTIDNASSFLASLLIIWTTLSSHTVSREHSPSNEHAICCANTGIRLSCASTLLLQPDSATYSAIELVFCYKYEYLSMCMCICMCMCMHMSMCVYLCIFLINVT